MGKVRTEHVKRIARELVERFPDKFTTDFENNKRVLESVAEIPTSKLRNKIAGYITRLMTMMNSGKSSEKTTENVDSSSE
ncbi:MAG TPA: 30S ribosomal protein S17e [Candidatus Bathyarchaeota archaeon]|nr:30S ribosomal protein S17e [Candidatus Bathyarchaeota archaeon]HEX69207.1 30S ribosomal protein S17e [Candidatus Bathyarchaeota archaeon]